MGMDIVKGRGFSKEYGTDTSAMVINESLARLLGMKDPIGQKLYTSFQDAAGNKLISYTIIGVVKDFHFESMRQNIGPLCFRLGKPDWVTAFKVNTTNISQLVKNIERIWKSYAPSMPFSYQFLDESFDNMYRVEERTGKLGLTLAIMAIMIACLGLFGLATYMAEQRIKEIGVRKVLGASVPNLVTLLSKDFVKLVIIASVLAIPLSWWAMHKWLQAFAYRITIDWWVYLVGCLLAMLIAIMTVSSQAIKAALSNPVKNLRTE
jgi:putative ABC transport system permease protein